MLRRILLFFDRIEDKVRGWLSRRPILYAFIGGTGIVLFWRGIWHTADYFTDRYLIGNPRESNSIDLLVPFWWDGFFSLIVGSLLLLITGLLVANFIGTEIIISGIKGEKKTIDRTETEIRKEAAANQMISRELGAIEKELKAIDRKIGRKRNRVGNTDKT